jgi:hypothetical protein
LAYNSPGFVPYGLDVFLYLSGLDVGIFGDQLAEFGLELWWLVDTPRNGRIEEDLHEYCTGERLRKYRKMFSFLQTEEV